MSFKCEVLRLKREGPNPQALCPFRNFFDQRSFHDANFAIRFLRCLDLVTRVGEENGTTRGYHKRRVAARETTKVAAVREKSRQERIRTCFRQGGRDF